MYNYIYIFKLIYVKIISTQIKTKGVDDYI